SRFQRVDAAFPILVRSLCEVKSPSHMVALDERYWEKPQSGGTSLSAPLLTAALAAAITFATVAAGGFGENALRLGSQAAWRFAFVVFFVLLAAGPLCRLAPLRFCRALGPYLRQLVFSFCAAM